MQVELLIVKRKQEKKKDPEAIKVRKELGIWTRIYTSR